MQQLLLILAVAIVGVLHTAVPDHWAPIALLARQRGWTRRETVNASVKAGAGHSLSTLAFGIGVWLVGVATAKSFGHWVDVAASVALVGFGCWIALGAWREVRSGGGKHPHHRHDHSGHHHVHDHDGGHAGSHHHDHGWTQDPRYSPLHGGVVALRHAHLHRHGGGAPHFHWHDHAAATAHAVAVDAVPLHDHRHGMAGRTALLLVLGSSPMVEGIPAFFAASRYGLLQVAVMSIVFCASTIAVYVALSVSAAEGLSRVHLGPVERYGEVISGAFIAVLGAVFAIWSLL
jgi:cytochrome c biogenesis protein CcdA